MKKNIYIYITESLCCTVEANTGLPRWLRGKNQSAMQETWVQSLGREDFLGGHGNPFQYSCLQNPMGRGAWWAAVHGVKKSWTRLSDWEHTQKLTERCKSTPLQKINLQKRNDIQATSEHFFKTLNAEDNGATYRTVTKPHSTCCHSGGDQKICSPLSLRGKKMLQLIL